MEYFSQNKNEVTVTFSYDIINSKHEHLRAEDIDPFE